MQYSDKTISTLARARHDVEQLRHADRLPIDRQLFVIADLMRSFRELDGAGVFAALDEQSDSSAALRILAESAQGSVNRETAGYPDTTPKANKCPSCKASHFKDADALQFHIESAH